MNDFFKRVKIRAKLLLAFGSIILLSVFLTVYAFVSIDRILALERLKEESENLSINLERIELATKEFIFEGYKSKSFQENEKSEMLDRYDMALAGVNENLKSISENKYLDDDETKKIVRELFESKVISSAFRETRDLLKRRGFKDWGLEGALREAIHKIENSSIDYDRVAMLTLRRHEKDFFLRKDPKYQTEFNKTADAFSGSLREKNKGDLVGLLNNYQNEFNQVVAIEKEIGFTDKEGKKGLLYSKLQEVRSTVEAVQAKVLYVTEAQIGLSRIWLSSIFFVQLATALVLALTYSNAFTSVIKEIKTTMTALASGTFPPPLKVQSDEEIGQTKSAINQFLERLKSATSFAEKLGSGRLNTKYDERFGGDVFAQALIHMQTKLSDADAIQSKINWNNEGIVRFNEAVKNDSDDLNTMGDKILRALVLFLNANQAALYVTNHDEKYFEIVSTYAYGKKRFKMEKIDMEDGLVAQCAKEKESIYLKEIPGNYVKITSGLGEATPRCLLLVPLKVRDEVSGVLEIASFQVFEEHQRAFVEKVAENIASLIATRQSSVKTKKLLEESKLKAEGLSAQEEELRQSAEELRATQEEMQRQRSELEMEIKGLKQRLQKYEAEEISLRSMN
ncbi:MAG TPA: GAF domain-containing protein [Cyclobacteriaceae bacterium]|nr:GAF domain-containing protein [Cyclobacteriaceae bacterium]